MKALLRRLKSLEEHPSLLRQASEPAAVIEVGQQACECRDPWICERRGHVIIVEMAELESIGGETNDDLPNASGAGS
ncbi:MAG: hypothetical protein HY347_04305 [candidate division NC10 bacterium]|nr:hypothetical protein [candidate division NC10 bacterium]